MGLTIEQRKQAFIEAGRKLARVLNPETARGDMSDAERALLEEINGCASKNAWFTPDNVRSAMREIQAMLVPEALENWLEEYPGLNKQTEKPKTIAVIMAGNIPFVGFHDMMCVILSGNRFLGKLSSQDKHLPVKFAGLLFEAEPGLEERVVFSDTFIKEFDAVIATGSNNSARYFDYYFGRYPHVIRKNRNSLAFLNGEETDEELSSLAVDVFQYFGMGCRNVSKIMVPQGYDFTRLLDSFESWNHLKNHSKYFNNYEYYKAIFLVNQQPHFDNGFCLLTEDHRLSSPLAVLHYEYYSSAEAARSYVRTQHDSLQCVVASEKIQMKDVSTIPPGQTQKPRPQDYADGVDTLSFLLNLR
ncbi:MAG: acyl-CoA reductase [bacterium]